MRLALIALVGCGFHHGSSETTGASDAPSAGDATDAKVFLDAPPAGCTTHTLPPSVNVDPAAWKASFLTSPSWSCIGGGTTTIDSTAGTVTSSSCALGTPDVTNDVAQASGGPSVMVVRLTGLNVTSGHVLRLQGNKPIVLLVAGDVLVDSGGMIDASAAGATAGPGGSLGSVCLDRASGLGLVSSGAGWGGGGGGFGTAGGQGCYNITNGGSAASVQTLVPLRGGCQGGITAGGSAGAGAGGGAVEISASGTITIGSSGAANIVASGGGGPAITPGGGNGGGAGGGILLVSPAAATLGASGALRANGGAGSEGCGTTCTTNAAGTDGHKTDSTPAADTSGVAGGGDNMDHGRLGGLADRIGSAALVTQPGDLMTAQTGGRGGGGGGGGVIIVATGTTVSSCD